MAFQFRGSPHIHIFVWILNTPTLNENSIYDYANFLDSAVWGNSRPDQKDSYLYQLIKIFQIHWHPEACRKYKNMKCPFEFGRFFTKKNIFAKPLQNILSQVKKFEIRNKWNNILWEEKKYIDSNLDPINKSFSMISQCKKFFQALK